VIMASIGFYVAWIMLMIDNTLSYNNGRTEFCIFDADVHNIDGDYQELSPADSVKCSDPVWNRIVNGSLYSGDVDPYTTYFLIKQTVYFDTSITGYGFYQCSQVEDAIDPRSCSLTDYCKNDFPLVICLEEMASPFECLKWKTFEYNNNLGVPADITFMNGSCPANLNKSSPVGVDQTHGGNHGQQDNSTSSFALEVWRVALIAVGIIAMLVVIISTICICRKYNVMDKVKYRNRSAIDDTDLSEEEEEEEEDMELETPKKKPPKKKAPPIPDLGKRNKQKKEEKKNA